MRFKFGVVAGIGQAILRFVLFSQLRETHNTNRFVTAKQDLTCGLIGLKSWRNVTVVGLRVLVVARAGGLVSKLSDPTRPW